MKTIKVSDYSPSILCRYRTDGKHTRPSGQEFRELYKAWTLRELQKRGKNDHSNNANT